LISAGWSALLTLILSWPSLTRLGAAALGAGGADGPKHLWTLWWMRRTVLREHAFPFTTDYVNFPYGMELYPIEPLNGLGAILLGFAPLVTAANLLAWGNLTLIGVCGGLLGRALARRDAGDAGDTEDHGDAGLWGGLAAGTLLQGAAISLFTIHVGVGELQHLWWLPLGFTAWLALRREPGAARAVALGLALSGAVLSCFYHGFFLAVGVSVLSLITLWAGGVKRTGKLLGAYLLAAGLSLAVVAPVTTSFATSYGTDERQPVPLKDYVLGDHNQPLTDPPAARLEPAQLVVPQRGRRASASASTAAYGGGRYMGLFAAALVLGALILRPRAYLPWAAVGVVGALIAMGSYLVADGEEVLNAAGVRYQLPFLWLNRLLGYLAEPLNFPVRAVALTATAAAAAAGLVASASVKGRSLGPVAAALALLSVVDVQVNQLNARPMAAFELTQWPELAELSETDGAMVDLTMAWNTDLETLMGGLSAQLSHGQKIQAVPIERLRYFALEGQYFVQALALAADSRAAQRGNITLDRETYRGDIALLRDAGFERVLIQGIGPRRDVPMPIRDALSGLFGQPEINGENAVVWALPEVAFTEAELTAWKAEHEQAMAALRREPPQHRGPGD